MSSGISIFLRFFLFTVRCQEYLIVRIALFFLLSVLEYHDPVVVQLAGQVLALLALSHIQPAQADRVTI